MAGILFHFPLPHRPFPGTTKSLICLLFSILRSSPSLISLPGRSNSLPPPSLQASFHPLQPITNTSNQGRILILGSNPALPGLTIPAHPRLSALEVSASVGVSQEFSESDLHLLYSLSQGPPLMQLSHISATFRGFPPHFLMLYPHGLISL